MSLVYLHPFLGLSNGLNTINAAVVGGGTFDSQYESRSALTTVQKQHFIEWFSGKSLNTNIWSGTGTTGSMSDGIDEGFKITTVSGVFSSIDFDNKRHYDYQNAILIGITKVSTVVPNHMLVGLGNDGFNTQWSYVGQRSNQHSFYCIDTSDGTETITDSDISNDTSSHVHKLELTSTNNKYYIDGVLKVTKTTNLPSVVLQPTFIVQRISGTTDFSGHIRYLEAYNT